MPSAHQPVSRRRVLLGAAGLAMLGAAACGSSPPPPEIDQLQQQLDLANRDAEMAREAAREAAGAAAKAGDRASAPILDVIAAERAAHARALADELTRAAGKPQPSTTPTTTRNPPPSLADVIAALRGSADAATALAEQVPGYRAGLLGSIAASCSASLEVPLAQLSKQAAR